MIEYLLNFLERMEEGFGETSDDKMQHMRMSDYINSNPKTGDSDRNTQASSDNNSESSIAVSINESQIKRTGSLIEYKYPSLEGPIDDSFFVHAAVKDEAPVGSKRLNEFTNSVYENFFGSNTMVTKMANKDTGEERIISKHK